jgi:Uma2 family endonuclease
MRRRSRSAFPQTWSLADLVEHLGGISPKRIRLHPAPGTATEEDVSWFEDHEDRTHELVEGVLVEKVSSLTDALMMTELQCQMSQFAKANDLGIVVGGTAAVRLGPRLVRTPDASFVSWERLPGRKIPREPIPDLAPDLAVEALCPENTAKEMDRKLDGYFNAGVRLVWYIDIAAKSMDVYAARDQRVHLRQRQILTGGDVLPGFSISLPHLFQNPWRRKRRA